jgi:hypothetical protein
MEYPVKLDADYPCRGVDARGQGIHFEDLLSPGQVVGQPVPGDPLNAFPPLGVVVERDGGLWIDAQEEPTMPTDPDQPTFDVGVNAWGWEPWGMSFAFGMALHLRDKPARWSKPTPREQTEHERRFPTNPFIQNARRADEMIDFYRVALSMPVHDRPMEMALWAGAYGRPDGGRTSNPALHAMEASRAD